MGGRFGIHSKSTTPFSRRTGFEVIGFLGRLPTRLVLRNRLGQGTGVWLGAHLQSDSMANRCHRAVPAFGRHFKRGDDWESEHVGSSQCNIRSRESLSNNYADADADGLLELIS